MFSAVPLSLTPRSTQSQKSLRRQTQSDKLPFTAAPPPQVLCGQSGARSSVVCRDQGWRRQLSRHRRRVCRPRRVREAWRWARHALLPRLARGRLAPDLLAPGLLAPGLLGRRLMGRRRPAQRADATHAEHTHGARLPRLGHALVEGPLPKTLRLVAPAHSRQGEGSEWVGLGLGGDVRTPHPG